jgi:hypothetical protein
VSPHERTNWDSSERRDPPGWDRMRRETLESDHHRCVWPGRWAKARGIAQCGAPATDVDHVRRGEAAGPDPHRAGNRQSLCRYHHDIKTQREAAEERARQRAKLSSPDRPDAPGRKHPGLR